MRAWTPALGLLLLVPLSGCLQGDTGSSTPFVPTCPNWTVADHPLAALVDQQLFEQRVGGSPTERTNSDTFPFSNGHAPAAPPPDEAGKKADRYLLRFPANNAIPIAVFNGTLTFRVYRNDTGEQLAITDGLRPDQPAKMEWTTGPTAQFIGSAQLQVSLVPPTQDPKPAAIRLDATFQALPGFVISSGAKTPRSGAEYSVEPVVSYRAPGCVQK